ncbi:hypothetical protein WJX84_003480 [Apatococcus fuscideae]|uniref:TF-B3 domain-containing protein n=1 Tax=Apatococcus fuscideae TaxID=2026836 RepID=A0AAW1T8V9_9CHLO
MTDEGRRFQEEIARNKLRNLAMLRGLGIEEFLQTSRAEEAAEQKKKEEAQARRRQERLQRDAEARAQQPLFEIRKSARCANRPLPTYKDDQWLRWAEQPSPAKRICKARVAAVRAPGGHRFNFNGPWQSDEARKAALDAAEAGCSSLKGAVVRALQKSQVSGGCWMHLPPRSALSACLQHTTHGVIMTCSDATMVRSSFTRVLPGYEQPTWKVVHLIKSDNSSGLSGGWRGFAYDNGLTPNDSIIFEARFANPSQIKAAHIHCHVFRAKDYEKEGYKPYWTLSDGTVVKSVPDEADQAGASEANAQEAKAAEQSAAAATQGTDKTVSGLVLRAASPEAGAAEAAAAADAADIENTTPNVGAARPDASAGNLTGAARKDALEPVVQDSKQATAHDPACKQGPTAAPQLDNHTAKRRAGQRWGSGSRCRPCVLLLASLCNLSAPGEVERPSENEDEFWVSQIQGFKLGRNGKVLYRIRWWSFGADEDTDEPAQNLNKHPLSYRWASKAQKAECAVLLAQQKA